MLERTDASDEVVTQRLLKVADVARQLSVAPITVRRLIRTGRLQSVRLSCRAIRIHQKDVDAITGVTTT